MKILDFSLLANVVVVANAQANVVVNRVVDSFSWTNPFVPDPTPAGFEAKCEETATFRATQHIVRDITEPYPVGLAPWADSIKYFFGGRPFPGSWEGIDRDGTNRDVIFMEYKDVPEPVKDWIQEKKRNPDDDAKWLFGVYDKSKGAAEPSTAAEGGEKPSDGDKVMVFAAGAIYETLPLWVAKGSKCEDELRDLGKYSATPTDQAVVAWVVDRTEPDYDSGKTEIQFTIKATQLVQKETNDGAATDPKEEDNTNAEDPVKDEL